MVLFVLGLFWSLALLIPSCNGQCSVQADCYSADITTAYSPFLPSIIRCQGGECICNECFETKFRVFTYDYCGLSKGCWEYVNYNSTLQTCRRNPVGERTDGNFEAPTGLLFGLGVGGCIILGLYNFYTWTWCAKRVKFSKKGVYFSNRFTAAYFISLGVVFFIVGLGVAIAWSVIRADQCVIERPDDDY